MLFYCYIYYHTYFFLYGKREFYLKQTKFIQHQHLGLGHIIEIPLGQIHPSYILHEQKWDSHCTQSSQSVGGSPALAEHLHSRLLHGTRGAPTPLIPDPRGSCNHKSEATYQWGNSCFYLSTSVGPLSNLALVEGTSLPYAKLSLDLVRQPPIQPYCLLRGSLGLRNW